MTVTAGPGQLEQTRVRVAPVVYKNRQVRHRCALFWLSAMFFLSRHIPRGVQAVKGFFLWWAWTFSRVMQDGTLANARHLLGPNSTLQQRRRLGKQVVGSFYDFISDIGRTITLSRDELQERIASVEGVERYRQVRSAGKGAIIATAHMGSFELGLSALLSIEKQIHVVFQRDAHSLFESLRSDFRKRMGIKEAAVDDGWSMWVRLRDALMRDEIVAIQADRAMPGQIGIKVPFLDGHTLFPEGPAKLAAITGSPLVPVFVTRLADGRVRIFIEEPIQVEDPSEVAIACAIEKLAHIVGRYVQQYPEQWLVVHRAWCEDMAGNPAGE